jgi:hypothetical protein
VLGGVLAGAEIAAVGARAMAVAATSVMVRFIVDFSFWIYLKTKSPPLAGGQSTIGLIDQSRHRAADSCPRHQWWMVQLSAIVVRFVIGIQLGFVMSGINAKRTFSFR